MRRFEKFESATMKGLVGWMDGWMDGWMWWFGFIPPSLPLPPPLLISLLIRYNKHMIDFRGVLRWKWEDDVWVFAFSRGVYIVCFINRRLQLFTGEQRQSKETGFGDFRVW